MEGDTPRKKKTGILDRLELQRENQQLNQQIDRLTKLHEIGGLLNSALDLEKILKKVVDEAVSIVSAEEGLIMLVDEITGELYVRAQKGFQEEFARGLRHKVEDSLAQDAILAKKSQTWTSKEKVLKLATGLIVNAIAYVPLIVEDKAIGVLVVDNRVSDRAFTVDDEVLLNVLANYAASAIRNSDLVHVLTARTSVSTSMHKTGSLILSVPALDEVLDQIAKEALRVLEADIIVLYQYFTQFDDVYVPPIIMGDIKDISRLVKKNLDNKLSSVFNLIGRGQPFYATDARNKWIGEGVVKAKEVQDDSFVFREGIVSSAGIPLIAGDETVGVMFVHYREKRFFSDPEKETIELLANQAAIAIQNARLLSEKDARIKELASLLETSRVVASSPTNLRNVLQLVADHARDVVNADYALVFPVDEKTGEFRDDLISISGISEQGVKVHSPRQDGMAQKVREGVFFVVEDTKDRERYPFIEHDSDSFIEKAKVRAVAGVELRSGQEFVGVLYVDFCNPRLFDEREIQTLQLFANQATVSIQNARLFEKVNLHVNELSILNQIGQTISASVTSGIDEMQNSIYEQIKGIMDVDNFYIALYDEAQNRVYFTVAIEDGQKQIIGQGEWAERIKGNGLTEYVILSKKPLLIKKDVDKWLIDNNVEPIEKRAAAWLGVPMLIGDKVLGVIAIQSTDQTNIYDEHHQDILLTIASQTAIALENVKLLQEQQRRLQELTALHEISLNITHELDQEILLQAIVQRAAELLNAPGGGLMLCDPEKKEVKMKHTHNLDVMKGYKFKYGEGLAGRVIQTGESRIVNDYHHWEDRDIGLDVPPYQVLFNSVVLAPLKWQEQVIGVLVISDNAEDRIFNPDDQHLLERFANQAAIAIQNSKLFNKKVKELEALRNADIAILSVLGLKNKLQTILDEISPLTQCDGILIRLNDEEKDELVLASTTKRISEMKIPLRIKKNCGSISARAAKNRKVIVVQDTRKDSLWQAFVETISDPDERHYLCWAQSEAAIPLVAKDQLVGVMTAQSHNRSGIHEVDVQLLKSFADPAAIAIHNAQLIEKNKEHTVLVAHQLKGPLQAVRGGLDYQLDYIQRNYGNDERLKHVSKRLEEYYGRIKNEMDKFSFLVREDLVVDHKYVKTSQSIDNLIGETIALFNETARHKGVEFVVLRGVYDLPRMTVDRENILTVFTNLIENAVKYSYHNKTIEINGERKGNRIMVSVSDYGLGVLPEDEDKIFELYSQGRLKDNNRFVQGTGIGLWQARKIMHAHGGDIRVWSELFNYPEFTASNPETLNRGFKTVFTVVWVV